MTETKHSDGAKGHTKDVKKADKPEITDAKSDKKLEARAGKGAKKEVKNEAKKAKKKEKPSYRIARTSEASEQAKEKSRLEKKKRMFRRDGFGKTIRVKDRWRVPSGIDSGQRLAQKRKRASPKVGYMTPKSVKGLHPTGYKPIRVLNVSQIAGINPKTEAIIIGATVGRRKRDEIQKLAQEKKIQILNFK